MLLKSIEDLIEEGITKAIEKIILKLSLLIAYSDLYFLIMLSKIKKGKKNTL